MLQVEEQPPVPPFVAALRLHWLQLRAFGHRDYAPNGLHWGRFTAHLAQHQGLRLLHGARDLRNLLVAPIPYWIQAITTRVAAIHNGDEDVLDSDSDFELA